MHSRIARASIMPFLLDILIALAAGLVTLLAAAWYARSPSAPAHPAEEIARAAGKAVRPHRGLRGFFVRRLDRTAVTGLLLTTALAITMVGAFLLGVLALLVRRVAAIQHVDNSVAAWAYDHRSAASSSALQAATNLGNIQIVVGLALLLVLIDLYRRRNGWTFLFVLTVLAGMEVSMLVVKDLVGRLRPTLNPAAASLGPSFPSGHSATAAAFYAAAALVIGRGLHGRVRHLAAAVAVAIAVAVAGSRVLLDLHWLSDVVGGLALGWAWFALCAIVFGGRLLVPTAAADIATAEAAPKTPRPRLSVTADPEREA
jgi:membrane-associated phospholipid phosphatase